MHVRNYDPRVLAALLACLAGFGGACFIFILVQGGAIFGELLIIAWTSLMV